MNLSSFFKNEMLFIRWEGAVKTHEQYFEFKNLMKTFLPSQLARIKENEPWRLVFINSYPINTYVLGYLLKLKQRNNLHFSISTDEYRFIELLENLEFDKMFELFIEQDPRVGVLPNLITYANGIKSDAPSLNEIQDDESNLEPESKE